ncbi:helix-turn-helix domain-containing protein [Gordonia sp. LSe1-13]|uniref:Helix-turn-helix domain-containing protein n=1 Tax=Gordonia sesuvii TaxID=3116777 RepID=A0ABU7M8W1_9ACTN|nr:helix-turn-helix domain-containing protein [Gordonia sp. LSe1-13]
MTRRSYYQFCGLSRALDVVGERWTLLIVRELMAGPKRYSDLSDALTGIGTSLLATRLKQLESDDIVNRRYLSPPAASTVYELTAAGQELADAMVPLAMWGARHHAVDGRTGSEKFRADWALLFLARLVDTTDLSGADDTYEFRVDDSTATMRVDRGQITVTPGSAVDTANAAADAVIVTDSTTMAAISGGRLTVADALAGGAVTIDGSPASLGPILAAIQERLPAHP